MCWEQHASRFWRAPTGVILRRAWGFGGRAGPEPLCVPKVAKLLSKLNQFQWSSWQFAYNSDLGVLAGGQLAMVAEGRAQRHVILWRLGGLAEAWPPEATPGVPSPGCFRPLQVVS